MSLLIVLLFNLLSTLLSGFVVIPQITHESLALVYWFWYWLQQIKYIDFDCCILNVAGNVIRK